MDVTALLDLGFVEDEDARSDRQAQADSEGMSARQPYVVTHVLTKGIVEVLIEQNTSEEETGEMKTVVTYPSVARVSSPKGATQCAASDVALIDALATELG